MNESYEVNEKTIEEEKQTDKVSEVQHIIDTLKIAKERLEEQKNQEKYNLSKSKLICSMSSGAFILSNATMAFLAPQALGISLLASGVLFASLSINELFETFKFKKIIKDLTNKINFFEIEINDANTTLQELKDKNFKEKKPFDKKINRHEIHRVFKKELLFEEYRKNERRILELFKNQTLDKYLSRKGYTSSDISLFHEIIEKDIYSKTKEVNEQIANKHYVLSQKSNSSENIGLYYK